MTGGLELRVDPGDFRRVMNDLKQFDRRLYLQLRRRIKALAKPLEDAVRAEVLKGGPSKTGMRAGIAAGVRTTVSTGKKPGVTTTASSSKMPKGKAPMVAAWNKSTFRHPVGGNREVWVTQAGHPYFYGPILEHRNQFQRALLDALKDVLKQMERA